MTTHCDDPHCPIIDEPLWSGKRLFFAVGRYLEERAVYDEPEHGVLYHLRFYRRPHAKEAWKHRKENRRKSEGRTQWT